MTIAAGRLNERVAFDAPKKIADGYGGTEIGWTDPSEAYCCGAELRYQRGGEPVDGAKLSTSASFKVRIRANARSRAITGDWRMRDLTTGTEFNIREVDAISDRRSVWLVVESGVAV